MRELTSRNANVLRYSESAANLLVDNGSNFAIFSECALISKEKLSDFDSAIPRFESWLRNPVGRPKVSPELHTLIGEMSGANPHSGLARAAREALCVYSCAT
jgi:hypothetical protein